ncbi:ATP-binding protein [Chryseobacterium sp. 09-1422]|uniref:ATP-binding protein n=1 Tax=Chryseobacterium kimseyorum TaxID=2984028 RepID=A0ABT3I296_9FLAO|nr:ATP-binding protein [Chryseobacterium kimseyorum]MCW3170158.1 ATP-binding protein [Chryseobacterium kimseyorum]
MIILQQQTPYLSLNQLENYKLNDFSIITGLNGSGKTHLLKAINEGAVKVEGIDQSGIIYYSYNDFNIFYDDLSKNNDLKIKSDFFANKSSSFSQNLVNQRSTILSQYKLNEGDYSALEYIIINSPDLIKWSEDEIEIFEKKQLEIEKIPLMQSEIPEFSPKQNNLINHIKKDFKTINIREWLLDKEDLVFRTQILNIIRNYNYNIEIINWYNSQINLYNLKITEDPNFQLHPIFLSLHNQGFDQNFINFLNSVNQYPILKKEFLAIKESFREIFNEIKKYFIKNISPEYLALSTKVNGEEKILNQINVDTGFLNLQIVADAEKNYQVAKARNEFNEFQSKMKGHNIHFMAEDQFYKHMVIRHWYF